MRSFEEYYNSRIKNESVFNFSKPSGYNQLSTIDKNWYDRYKDDIEAARRAKTLPFPRNTLLDYIQDHIQRKQNPGVAPREKQHWDRMPQPGDMPDERTFGPNQGPGKFSGGGRYRPENVLGANSYPTDPKMQLYWNTLKTQKPEDFQVYVKRRVDAGISADKALQDYLDIEGNLQDLNAAIAKQKTIRDREPFTPGPRPGSQELATNSDYEQRHGKWRKIPRRPEY